MTSSGGGVKSKTHMETSVRHAARAPALETGLQELCPARQKPIDNAICGKYDAAIQQLNSTRENIKAMRALETTILRSIQDIEAAARVLDVTLPKRDEAAPPPHGSLRAFVLAQLVANPTGIKSKEIHRRYAATGAAEIHAKSVGVALLRLLNQGHARRVGHLWYPA